jgi:hypothetical protein
MDRFEDLISNIKKAFGRDQSQSLGRLFHANEAIGIFFEIFLVAPIEAGWIWSKDIRKELMSFGAFFAFMVGAHKPAEQENV